MFAGVAMLAIIFKLAIVVGIIIFAVKLLNRITDIAASQKSIADSQVELINVLSKKQSTQGSVDV
ncbi:hypothetical protein ACWXWU_04480 [Shewanella sp. A14]